MKIYQKAAKLVAIIHTIVIIILLCSPLFYFISIEMGRMHSIFVVFVLSLQLLFGFKCPLTLLERYLHELSDPEYPSYAYNEPFIVRTLRSIFGFELPGIAISIVTIILGGMGILVLMGNYLLYHR